MKSKNQSLTNLKKVISKAVPLIKSIYDQTGLDLGVSNNLRTLMICERLDHDMQFDSVLGADAICRRTKRLIEHKGVDISSPCYTIGMTQPMWQVGKLKASPLVLHRMTSSLWVFTVFDGYDIVECYSMEGKQLADRFHKRTAITLCTVRKIGKKII
jgi:hypothetical protein